ncbi:MAG: hypothetical protein WDM81_13815 [Rhizomicrobium sp.]
MAVCELGPVKAKKPLGDLSRFAVHGRRMIGRLITESYRYDATFEAYRAALLKAGHKDRGADTFGALGAAYDLLMYDRFDQGTVEAWASMLPAGRLAETANAESDTERCISRLVSFSCEAQSRRQARFRGLLAARGEEGDQRRRRERRGRHGRAAHPRQRRRPRGARRHLSQPDAAGREAAVVHRRLEQP